jgi:hypothetical protein
VPPPPSNNPEVASNQRSAVRFVPVSSAGRRAEGQVVCYFGKGTYLTNGVGLTVNLLRGFGR